MANLSSAELVTHSDSPRRRPRRTSGWSVACNMRHSTWEGACVRLTNRSNH